MPKWIRSCLQTLFLYTVLGLCIVLFHSGGLLTLAYRRTTVDMPLWLFLTGILLACFVKKILRTLNSGLKAILAYWHQRQINRAIAHWRETAQQAEAWEALQRRLRQSSLFDKIFLLEPWVKHYPEHREGFLQLAQAYSEKQDWEGLSLHLAQSAKRSHVRLPEYCEFQCILHKGQLMVLAKSNPSRILHCFNALPRALRALPEMKLALIHALCQGGYDQQAADHIKRYLNKTWSEQAFIDYLSCDLQDKSRHLRTAETWLSQHPGQAESLYHLGKLCFRQGLLGKAKAYFQSSLGIEASPKVHWALAQLATALGDPTLAQTHYRLGLAQAVKEQAVFIWNFLPEHSV